MKERKHAIEILKKILQQRIRLLSARQRLKNPPLKKVIEDFRPPVIPARFVFGGGVGDHGLEAVVAGLFVDPLNAFWGKDGEAGGRADVARFAAVVGDEGAHLVGEDVDFFGVFFGGVGGLLL